jgi:serine/threonine protein kinase/uncharacterized integral membrane protein
MTEDKKASLNKPLTRRDPYRLIGEMFDGRYRLEAFAGMGSFGAVYRAMDMRVGRAVAVKILKPDLGDDEATEAHELFQREALTAGRLVHPHIVAVTDVGEDSGFAYLVMEWLEGSTLEDELRTRVPFSPEEIASLLAPISDALQTAHDAGVIHRDIKPSNIHLGKRERPFVKVLDFGIAKVVTSSTAVAASRIAGTVYYMSPEQITGGRIDRRSDIYSLGILLYQLLTGELPFKGESQGHIIQQHIAEMPPLLSESRPNLPPALSHVIQRALAKLPGERQQSAEELNAEFADALTRKMTQPTEEDSLHEQKTILLQSSRHPTVLSPTPVEQSPVSTIAASAMPPELPPLPEKQQDAKVELVSESKEEAIASNQQGEAHRPGKILIYAFAGAVIFLILGYWWLSANQQSIEDLGLFVEDTFSKLLWAEVWQDSFFGLSLGILICSLRNPFLWSTAKRNRARAFVVHAAALAFISMAIFYLFYFLPAISENKPESWTYYFFHRFHLSAIVFAFWGALIGFVIWMIRILTHNSRREVY